MKDKERIFIDTNILVYGIYGASQQKTKVESLLTGHASLPIISIQVLKEFTNVSFKKKFHKTPEELKQHLTKVSDSFVVSEITTQTIFDALALKEQYHYSFYDSLILATALENKCGLLYTEDMQHDQVVRRKLRIINPFK